MKIFSVIGLTIILILGALIVIFDDDERGEK